MHGAFQEAMHVYIESGIAFWKSKSAKQKESCAIFEMGFGTGLNALLTLEYSKNNKLDVFYQTIEPFPLSYQEVDELKFDSIDLLHNSKTSLRDLHMAPWEQSTQVGPQFRILKNKTLLKDFKPENQYDIVFYDAFGFRVQPEMWSKEALRPIVNALAPQGVLVTYSAKGSVRRALQALGLNVFRIEGPPGKREMLRAIRS